MQWYNHCSRFFTMQNGGAPEIGTASKEIRFDCPHCSAPLVVDAGATVKLLDCKRCKKSVRVPRTIPAAQTPPPPKKSPPAVTPRPSTPSKEPPATVAAPKAAAPSAPSPEAAPIIAAPPIETSATAPPSVPGRSDEALSELHRRLKENQSQRTEITGHINQLNIQLHRWQHRLNMLNERLKELEAQIAAANKNQG
jgi:hypothetical protein